MNPSPNIPVKTADDAIEALRQVVRGREDFVYRDTRRDADPYERCVNWTRETPESEWQPSCVVGHVLMLWGFPDDLMDSCSASGISVIRYDLNYMADPKSSKHREVPYEIDFEAGVILTAAQATQDSEERLTWGRALEAAEWYYANPGSPMHLNPYCPESEK